MDQYVLENHHPPLVDRVSWEKAQEILRTRQRNPGTPLKQHARQELFGKISCGLCGSSLSHYASTTRNGTNHYWRCMTAKDRNIPSVCPAGGIREENILYSFMIMLNQLQDDPGWFRNAESYIAQASLSPAQKQRLDVIPDELLSLFREIHQLTDRLVSTNVRNFHQFLPRRSQATLDLSVEMTSSTLESM